MRWRWPLLSMMLMAAVLTGCGFHLRGSTSLPPQLRRVFVDYHGGYNVLEPTLKKELIARLKARGAHLVDRGGDDTTTLNLLGVRQPSRSVAVGSAGQTEEYELTVIATYSLVKGDKTLIKPTSVSASQEYTYTVSRILSENRERRRIIDALQTRLAEQILVRLNATLAKSPD